MSWPNLLGHEANIAMFRHVVAGGRLGHAYLFMGPEGIGKRHFALELAKALNCDKNPTSLDACDTCPSCKQIDSGNHPDVEVLGLPGDKHEFPIEEVRNLISRINLKPAHARRRVVIVDDASALSEAAANAFLKTLEEPPPHSLLILIGTQREHFLPTILSRCQHVFFRPLETVTLAKLLIEQELAKTPVEANDLAEDAEGSLGQARLLADPAVRQFQNDWLQGWASPKVDPVSLADKLNKFVEEAGTESAVKRARAQLVIKFILETLLQALAATTSPTAQVSPAACTLADRFGPRRLLMLLERTLEAEQQISRYLQLALVLEGLTDTLCPPAVAK